MTDGPNPSGFFRSLIDPFSDSPRLRLEKARLEAFLSAVPGEYCGFSSSGAVVFSEKFAEILNLPKIESVTDIQNALSTSDAAALEGQHYELSEKGKPFSLTVRLADEERILRLSGSRGQALEGSDSFEIFWVEDITLAEKKVTNLIYLMNGKDNKVVDLSDEAQGRTHFKILSEKSSGNKVKIMYYVQKREGVSKENALLQIESEQVQ